MGWALYYLQCIELRNVLAVFGCGWASLAAGGGVCCVALGFWWEWSNDPSASGCVYCVGSRPCIYAIVAVDSQCGICRLFFAFNNYWVPYTFLVWVMSILILGWPTLNGVGLRCKYHKCQAEPKTHILTRQDSNGHYTSLPIFHFPPLLEISSPPFKNPSLLLSCNYFANPLSKNVWYTGESHRRLCRQLVP